MDKSFFVDYYYNNAEVNSIIIMNDDASIIEVNKAFTRNFGYTTDDLKGKNFNVLFTQEGNHNNLPKYEHDHVLKYGQSHDENYLVDKYGNAIWCTGESMLAKGADGKRYIIKDVLNLQAKKQLDLFLRGAEDLLERILESSKHIPMIVLDGSMKIQNANKPFLDLFNLTEMPSAGSGLSSLNHPFWQSPEIKKEISQTIVTNQPFYRKDFTLETETGEQKVIRMDSKITQRLNSDRKIFIVLEEINV